MFGVPDHWDTSRMRHPAHPGLRFKCDTGTHSYDELAKTYAAVVRVTSPRYPKTPDGSLPPTHAGLEALAPALEGRAWGGHHDGSALAPALEGRTWVDWWIGRADYYDDSNMPHIQFFESTEGLAAQIARTDLRAVSD
eukprot:gene25848-41868_t